MRKLSATIFGSSSPEQGSEQYNDAYELGKFLVEKGLLVRTGGYYGTMEAASRGALDAGQKAIGVPLDSFDPKAPNIYCDPQKVRTIFERLERLIVGQDLITILPGQLGTLTEFFLVWEMLESRQLNPPPEVVCIGENWPRLIEAVATIQNTKPADLQLIKCCKSVAEFRASFNDILTGILTKKQ